MRRLAILFLIAFCVLMIVSPAFADVSDSSGMTDKFLNEFDKIGKDMGTFIYQAAHTLFWILAAIELSWAWINLGMRGELSLTSFAQVLFKEIMLVGIFYWLLQNWSNLGSWIVEGIMHLGASASGASAKLNPADVLAKGVEIAYQGIEAGFDIGILRGIAAVLPCGIILIAFAFAAAATCIYMVEWYIILPAGVLLLGLGGSTWTKSYAEGYLKTLFSIGMKLFTLQIILYATSSFMDEMLNEVRSGGADDSFFQFMFSLAGISIITYMVVQKVPEFASALVSGGGIQSNGQTLTSAATQGMAPMMMAAGMMSCGARRAFDTGFAYSDAKTSFGCGMNGGGEVAAVSNGAGAPATDVGSGGEGGAGGEGGSGGTSGGGGAVPSAVSGSIAVGGAVAAASNDDGGEQNEQGEGTSLNADTEAPSASMTSMDVGETAASAVDSMVDAHTLDGTTKETMQNVQSAADHAQARQRAVNRAARRSAMRYFFGFGPTGSHSPGGGGAFKWGDVNNYPPAESGHSPAARGV